MIRGDYGVVDGPPPRFTCDDDEDDEDDDYEDSWVQWFCSLEGHEFLAEVEEEYIRDRFNLFGLKAQILNFEKALVTILSEGPSQEDMPESEYTELYRDARDLYGLIHARYITSPRGLALMKEKFMRGAFGQCPRVLCDRQNTLPVGLTDHLDEYNVRLYCPRCQETYEVSRKSNSTSQADGAYFGTSFPHVFLQSYPNLVPIDPPVPYVPKIFGFRVWNKKSIIQVKVEKGEYGDSLVPPHLRSDHAASSSPGGEDDTTATSSKDSNTTGPTPARLSSSAWDNATTQQEGKPGGGVSAAWGGATGGGSHVDVAMSQRRAPASSSPRQQ